MISITKWGAANSAPFPVPLGIKQGGINSPDLFAIYFDGITKLLRKKKIGCHIFDMFLAMILFADDLCLLSPTRSVLAEMISSVSDYCSEYGLAFNPSKSKILVFSKSKVDFSNYCPIYLAGMPIKYAQSVKYLGTTIVSNLGLTYSCTEDLRNFYRASNAILNTLKKPKEEVLMHLLYTNCVPILTYACSAKIYSSKEMRDCNTALNDAIRKIFGFHRWESVRHLREGLGYKSLYDIFAIATRKFAISSSTHHNSIVRRMQSCSDTI